MAAIVALLTAPAAANAATYRWNVDGDGDWNNAANWVPVIGPPGYPDAQGDIAIFPANATTADRVITIPDAFQASVGQLIIEDDDMITISGDGGTGFLVMEDGGPVATIATSGAAHRIHAWIIAEDDLLISNTGPDAIWLTRGITEANNSGRNVSVEGIVRFAGHLNNSYTGETRLLSGRLDLAHTGGTYAIPGILRIGSGAGPDVVRVLGFDQFALTSTVILNTADAVFDVNSQNATIQHLDLAANGDVTIGDGRLTVDRVSMAGGLITSTANGRLVLAAAGQGISSTIGAVIPMITGGSLELGPGDHPIQVVDTPEQNDLDITSKIIGPGSLTKTLLAGGGTLRLAAASTYEGATSVLGGGFLVAGSITSPLTMNSSAAVLMGTGTVGSVTAIEGRIQPGAFGPGILSTGAVTLASQIYYEVGMTGTLPGQYDRLNVTGAVALNDAQLYVSRAFDPAPGDTFLIVNNDGNEPIEGRFANKPEGTAFYGENDIVPYTITYFGGDGNDVVLTVGPIGLTYKFAEGATGSFFDTDVLIANPNDAAAPAMLTFFKEDGTTVAVARNIPGKSRVTVHVDELDGLEATTAAIEVRSETGLPLVVERTMFWDASRYGGHTETASESTSPTWAFAEGAQGFFDTYFLVQNPHASPVDVTMRFLREQGTPFETTVSVLPHSRRTIYAGDYAELQDRTFGTRIVATLPVVVERAMYFGNTPEQLWTGGHASTGASFLTSSWILAEGATGDFFDTFVLLSNPQNADATVTMTYLLPDGQTVQRQKNIPANGRLTVNIEAEDDPRLHHTAVSTLVQSNVDIAVERSMYWQAGAAQPWGEAHHGVGFATEAGSGRWGLAEGRVGGPLNFSTYILLANFDEDQASEVSITYLREAGAPVVKSYTVPASTRFTLDVRALVPELQDESFGAIVDVTSGPVIHVERAMYWDANGITWAGGTNSSAVPLPES